MTNTNLMALMQLNNCAAVIAQLTSKSAASVAADPIALAQAQAAASVIQTNLTALNAAIVATSQPS